MVESLDRGASGTIANPVFTGGVSSQQNVAMNSFSQGTKSTKIVQETGDGDFTIRPHFRERYEASNHDTMRKREINLA